MPRKSDARQRLLEAASALLWESSYAATSVDSICARSGVKKGSFYYFFESKSDLAIAALDAYWDSNKLCCDACFSATVRPLRRFADYFDLVYTRQAIIRRKCGWVLGCPLFSLGCEIRAQDRVIRRKINDLLGRYLKYFESAIRDAHSEGQIVVRDIPARAVRLFAFFEGMMMQARIQNNLALLRDLNTGTLELLGAARTAIAPGRRRSG